MPVVNGTVDPVDPAVAVQPSEPARAEPRRVLVAVAGFVLLGVIAGAAWAWLADPAQWEARDRGLVLTEAASTGQFSVVALFVMIGVVASLIGGVAATWLLRSATWHLTVLVAVLSGVASLIAWGVGLLLGPADPSTVTGLSAGDLVDAQLKVDTPAAFLLWPVAGLIGVVLATAVSRRR